MKSIITPRLFTVRTPLMSAMMVSVLLLSGCSVHKVAGEIAGVDVEASRGDKDNDHHAHSSSGNGGFCPPGHRKKGSC
ncbi:hypothetical protein ACFQ45_08750 [Rhodanobacter aciditrophus]|uniref:Lipoprotein n=1 Tax=Rhodanobacter aciditrophus TaxID=1623218 RepID=A0ABW4B084_9GAMM